jgi:hypothetical protein
MSDINKMRVGLRMATFERWDMDPEAHPQFIVDRGIREARLWAEEQATTDPYIFTDDDVLPWGKDWLRRGLTAMQNHPEFAACSSRSVIAEERGNYQIPDGVEIMEVPCVGAPLWMRKGILKDDIREFLFVEECIELHNYLRLRGYKEGIIAGLEHLHLGYGFATNPSLVRGY